MEKPTELLGLHFSQCLPHFCPFYTHTNDISFVGFSVFHFQPFLGIVRRTNFNWKKLRKDVSDSEMPWLTLFEPSDPVLAPAPDVEMAVETAEIAEPTLDLLADDEDDMKADEL